MAIGSRKTKKKKSVSSAQRQAAINHIAGVTEAAYLAAAADGEVSRDEYKAVAGIIIDLFDGQIEVDEIVDLINTCEQALEEEGFDARMDAIASKLPSSESQVAALYAVSGIILGDDEYDADSEGQFYDDLVEKLGFTEEVAIEIWNDQVDAYGWG